LAAGLAAEDTQNKPRPNLRSVALAVLVDMGEGSEADLVAAAVASGEAFVAIG